MDKRMQKRVVLTIGLVFLVLTALAGLIFWTAGQLQREETRKLGALAREYPQTEAELAQAFFGEEGENKESFIEAGEKLEDRYGYSFWSKGQAWLLWAVGGMALLLALGMALGAVLFLQYRSIRKQQEESLRKIQEKLRELQDKYQRTEEKLSGENQKTKSLITDISHQLKTPMASLKMSCELANSPSLDQKEKEEFQKAGLIQARKMENLLDSLIRLSRLEAGMIQIRPEIYSLRETLNQAVSAVYLKAGKKKIQIVAEEFQDMEIPHDRTWTAEAFTNILDNSIKYSPENSRIQIRIARLVSYVMIEFQDQGPGIPSEEKHKIFQRFYRGRDHRIQEQEGSGVGLYLARTILEAEKGTICTKKPSRGGSIFCVTLPLE